MADRDSVTSGSASQWPSSSRSRWVTVSILLGAASSVLWIWVPSGLDGSDRFTGTVIVVSVVVSSLAILCSLTTGSRRALALRILAAVCAAVAVAAALVRVEGVSGDFVPLLVWRWNDSTTHAKPISTARAKVALVDLTQTTPQDYPQFLGPKRNAEVQGVRLSRDWDANPPRLLWRRPIGRGWSAFAVVGSHAVTQEQHGDQEMTVCYELKTGEVCWVHKDDALFHSVVAGDGPRATPTIVDGRVYTFGPTGRLKCLDGARGNLLWQRDTLAENDAVANQWGKSCSPLLLDGLVVVSVGGSGGRSLLSYNASTGNRVWSGGDDRAGYSSPVLTTLCGTRQILILNENSVAAHDAASGRLLWDFPWGDRSQNISQPVALGDDTVFVSTGYGVGCALLKVTQDGQGEWTTTPLWRNLNLKTKFTNVVARESFIYGLDQGILTCIDAATGRRQWKRGRYGHGQILLVDDLILIQAESGDVVLVDASPDGHNEVARFSALSDKTWNNPVLVGRYLLVRNDREAACYELALARSTTLKEDE